MLDQERSTFTRTPMSWLYRPAAQPTTTIPVTARANSRMSAIVFSSGVALQEGVRPRAGQSRAGQERQPRLPGQGSHQVPLGSIGDHEGLLSFALSEDQLV